jgi:hypothetical protein
MKTFQQTRDVLENSIDFHSRTSLLYADLAEKTVNERAKLLLNYMSIHEAELMNNQKMFNKGASKKVMDTWLQFTPEQSNQSFFDNLGIDGLFTISDVTGLGFQIDSYLEQLYLSLEKESECSEVRDLFHTIRDIELQEKKELSKTANGIYDL